MKFIKYFHKHNYLFVLSFSVFFIIILGLSTWRLSFRLDTDYNLLLPVAQFAINAFTKPAQFLTWNPYIGLGVPVLGDPNSFVLSPWYVPILLLFGADRGLRVIIALSFIVSGYSMWVLLCSLHVSKKVAIWGSFLYQTSGAFAALVASGHVERLASYAVTPYVFLFLWKRNMMVIHRIAIGLMFACMYLTNDLYTPWFLSIYFVAFSIYFVISKRKKIQEVITDFLYIYGAGFVFALPKLIPFVRDILPHFDRLSTIDPYMGSVHAIFLPLSYVVPWQVTFWDRPTFQRLLEFRFNWYEYYAFITPIPFIFLLKIRKILKKPQVIMIFIALVVSMLYIALKFPYSPFYWLFHGIPFFRSFRVPQRIVVPLLVPVITLVSYCVDSWFHEKKHASIIWILLVSTLIWTTLLSFQTMKSAFVPAREVEKTVADELRRRDGSAYYVASFVCCIQPALLDNAIPILNYYYGWVPTYAPRFTNIQGDRFDFAKFSYIRPSYIIADKRESFVRYGYLPYFDKANIQVWKTENPTIYPNL